MRLDMLRKSVLLLCVTDGLLAPAALLSGAAPLVLFAGLVTGTAVLAGVSLARRRAAGSAPAATGEPTDRSGARLGPYTLVEKIGEGGMGTVYRARHDASSRPVAVKVLRPDRAGADLAARFEREVRLTAQLTHPNTVRVLDHGRADDTCYYAMEYLGGGSLADAVAQNGPMAPARVIRILDQIAGALAEVHAAGHLHRDIKPANIVLADEAGDSDVAKLVDFGLVKPIGAVSGGDDTELAITRSSSLAGTPLYMSPESITLPDDVDGRSDLYALGAVGYYLLTGRDVFTGRNILQICGHHLHSMPVPPSERLGAELPADLEALILACLEKDASRRPADAAAFQASLRACRDAASA